MSAGGLNSVVSRQSARHAVALGLVLLSVTVAGAALGGVTAAESQSGPVEISDWTDLDDIRNNPDAGYVLVTDLNETTPGYETVAGPNANNGRGFDPIGGFSGSFDGQGNTIANLTIDRGKKDAVGLFGRTSGDAVIEEVILAGATVNGSVGVGALVGVNDEGTVSNSSASATVTGSLKIGGLVGNNNRGTVSNSSASAIVTGSFSVGGLVGFNRVGAVSNSSASGAVNGTSVNVGGLVGNNFGGTVRNASANGAVDGSNRVGGLVGANVRGTVSESFATGAVTGSSRVGGLVGQLGFEFIGEGEVAILRDGYYDTQATGQQAAVGTIREGNGTAERRGEVAGLSTSQMQGASAAQNMAALDFTSTWRVVTDPPGYPELSTVPTLGRNPSRDSDGDGFNNSSNESGSDGDDSGGENETNESSGDGSGPGFGVGGALAGLGGAGYLLKRRLDDENRE